MDSMGALPTAADYAMSAAQDAQRSVATSERRRNSELARIEQLESRVTALESTLARLVDVLAAKFQ